jgi:hypothetical protein
LRNLLIKTRKQLAKHRRVVLLMIWWFFGVCGSGGVLVLWPPQFGSVVLVRIQRKATAYCNWSMALGVGAPFRWAFLIGSAI